MVKKSHANGADTRNTGLIPRSGRSPGEGNINSLQYFCLGNSTARGAWWTIVRGVTKSLTRLSKHACYSFSLMFGLHVSMRGEKEWKGKINLRNLVFTVNWGESLKHSPLVASVLALHGNLTRAHLYT